jgi:tyrosinase
MERLTSADLNVALILDQPTTRRIFIKGVGLVGTALLLGSLGGCEELAEEIRNRPTRRRLRTGSAQVDADIATYKQAVIAMKGLPGTDPRNWAAEAAIHGTAAGFNFCQHGTDHFFDWHRAYLLYFERICQKLTGNSRFGLPYWNWNQDPDIHPAFLDSSSPLFMPRARTSMSGSSATSSAVLDGIFADTNFYTFWQQLEGTPHNTVHTYIGGRNPFGGGASASDPLFWAHHCMVDYCWYKWNIDLGNNNTNDSAWVNWSDTHFVDQDGSPASTTAGITTIMPLLSYQYEESAIGSSPAAQLIRNRREFKAVEKRVREGANIRFDVKQRVRLAEAVSTGIARPVSLETKLSPSDFAQIINGDLDHVRIFASIEYAHLPASNDFAVRVFVNLPNANGNTPITDVHYAGSFAFFGTDVPTTMPAAEAGMHHHQPRFLVDLTATIVRLKRSQELKDGVPISLRLVAVPFGDKFEMESAELVLTAVDIITTPVIINAARR